LEAWALIRNESNLATTETKMKNLFSYFVNVHSLRAQSNNNQPDYTNMDAFQIRGKIDFGLLMPDPELLHDGVRQLKNLYKGRFFSDGWWNEPANAYHADLQKGLNWASAQIPTDYSYTDPIGFISVDGSRYDSFSIKTNLNTTASASVYAENVVQKLKYPNDYPVAIGDTYDYYKLTTDSRYSNLPIRITPTPSVLFGTSCIGTLTNGTTGNETMVTMRYGANNVHAHKDKLNINVWCKGQEIISETTYQPLSGDTASSRGWHQSTPGHVTVTVNEMNQYNVGTYADLRRKKTDNPTLDAIPGMPDWNYRWNMSASNDYGSLRLFNTDFSKVKVMEVDAEKAYTAIVSGMSKYRRTISLVEIDNGDTYIVDIFRVTGGSTHDYMLHSCLQADHTVSINTVESSTTASGKLYPSGQSTGTPQETWGLDKPTKASSVTTSSGWSAIFTPTAPSENWKLHTYMLGSSGTQIIKLDAPAMRRIGNAPFVCVRRNGNQNVYIAVHHGTTKTQSSRITGIQSVSSTNSNVIAFKVTFDNGRTDTIISGETPTSSATIDGRISFTGAFGHLAENIVSTANNQWAYLVDGSQFTVGSLSITGNVSHSGTVTSINRMESGGIDNSFVTNSSISSNFNNYTMLVDPTNLQRYAYTIDSVIGTTNSKIKILGEPGLSITGSTIKQEYFPNWGSTGTVQYRIPGSALMIKISNQWNFTKTGSAIGVAPPV
jgi:hypothetical protein